ncbi:MAG TPA: hypothetical protein VM901_07610 [Bdellovibrionota bacterium]|nr:hypothetical protein [Bdellovibrionota bacterium]
MASSRAFQAFQRCVFAAALALSAVAGAREISESAQLHARRMGQVLARTDFFKRLETFHSGYEQIAYGGTSRELDDFVRTQIEVLGSGEAFDTWIAHQETIALNTWHSPRRDIDIIIRPKDPATSIKDRKTFKALLLKFFKFSPEYKTLDVIIPELFFGKFPVTMEHYEPTSNVAIAKDGYFPLGTDLDAEIRGQTQNLGELGLEAMARGETLFYENAEIVRHRNGSEDLTHFRQLVRWIRLMVEVPHKTVGDESMRTLEAIARKLDRDKVVQWLRESHQNEDDVLERERIVDSVKKLLIYSQNRDSTRELLSRFGLLSVLEDSGFTIDTEALHSGERFSRVAVLEHFEAEVNAGRSPSDEEITSLWKILYPEHYEKDLEWMMSFDARFPELGQRMWQGYFSSLGGLHILNRNTEHIGYVSRKIQAFMSSEGFNAKHFFVSFRKNYARFSPAARRIAMQVMHVSAQDHATRTLYLTAMRKLVAEHPEALAEFGTRGMQTLLKHLLQMGNYSQIYDFTLTAMIEANPEAFREFLPQVIGMMESLYPRVEAKTFHYKDYLNIYITLLRHYPQDERLVSYGMLKTFCLIMRRRGTSLTATLSEGINLLVLHQYASLGNYRGNFRKVFKHTVTPEVIGALVRQVGVSPELISVAAIKQSYRETLDWLAEQVRTNPERIESFMTRELLGLLRSTRSTDEETHEAAKAWLKQRHQAAAKSKCPTIVQTLSQATSTPKGDVSP